jgi:hypothetical protein
MIGIIIIVYVLATLCFVTVPGTPARAILRKLFIAATTIAAVTTFAGG